MKTISIAFKLWANRYKTTFLAATAVISLAIAACEAARVKEMHEINAASTERNQLLKRRLSQFEASVQKTVAGSSVTARKKAGATESNNS